MRLALVTRGYPSEERIYNHGFVHRRVLAYRERGIDVSVFWLRRQPVPSKYGYDGVDVTICNSAFCLAKIEAIMPDAVAVHAPADDFEKLFSGLRGRYRIVAWIYGSEMMPFFKVTERADRGDTRWMKAKTTFERRIEFWRQFLAGVGPEFILAFVSEYSRRVAEEALGFPVRKSVVLPSPIDTDLFQYQSKPAEQRFNILSVRPFSDWRYANDISVEVVTKLKDHARFCDLRFHFYGTGHLFDETLAPIRHLPNVICENQSLTQTEIAQAHRHSGIFLCPTRDDAQGVSRDEAMSSGLVIASNAVGAVPEFADRDCAILAQAEDAHGIAHGIAKLMDAPSLFQKLSEAAAIRIQKTIAMHRIVPQEIQLLAEF